MHLLFAASTAFTLWMMVDAIQKGIACRWGWLIMIPGGELAYFFAVKIHDFKAGGAGPARLTNARRSALPLFDLVTGSSARPDLEELRDRVEQSPCLENRLDLACALHAAGEHREALSEIEIALKQDDTLPEVHYGAALCHMALGQHAPAEERLRAAIALQSSFDDYAAWVVLARVLDHAGRTEEALETLRELERTMPRLDHSLYLAQALHLHGQDDEARARIERALKDFDRAPAHVRRLAGGDARDARKLLAQLA